uniref:DUF6598 domain-containing protein n=1 Tax=Oryza glumipatula TaxID=40148 RepID=A0A0E0BPL8_9ORYZ
MKELPASRVWGEESSAGHAQGRSLPSSTTRGEKLPAGRAYGEESLTGCARRSCLPAGHTGVGRGELADRLCAEEEVPAGHARERSSLASPRLPVTPGERCRRPATRRGRSSPTGAAQGDDFSASRAREEESSAGHRHPPRPWYRLQRPSAWLSTPDLPEKEIRKKRRLRWLTADASPMRNTDRPVPPYYLPISMMQFFSVKVIEIMGGLQWPLHVYGIVATRDSQDNKRNFLFRCDREHCQTLASPQDSCLRLTRPSRAIVMVNPVVVEVDLKVKGSRGPPSEDKLESTEDSTMEFAFAHLQSAVEATITARVVEGSPDFRARKLIVRMEATDHGGDDTAVVKEEIFCARKTSRSQNWIRECEHQVAAVAIPVLHNKTSS